MKDSDKLLSYSTATQLLHQKHQSYRPLSAATQRNAPQIKINKCSPQCSSWCKVEIQALQLTTT